MQEMKWHKVERFWHASQTGTMERVEPSSPYAEYVKASDYDALAKTADALYKALDGMMREFGELCDPDCDSECCPFFESRAALKLARGEAK